MTSTSKYNLPKGTSADGPYGLLVTPESAGRGHPGLRILTLRPGEAHTLSTGDSEFLGLPSTWDSQDTDDRPPFGENE
ncbi:hypothetical protein [Streptomyces sp. NPDC008240]|uniref:hypothetical protein n=1 Tax=Streptomyces sp. NPDC008240 TaxID=3364822 RepID=UPI0036E3D86A